MLLEETAMEVVKQATLGKWYDEYGPRLLAMLEHRLDPRSAARREAKDLLHDAFVRAEKRWDDYTRSGMTPYAWLYRLALDCLLDDHDYQHRQNRSIRKERAWPEQSSQQLVLGLFGSEKSPSKALAGEELRQRMAGLLARLKPEDREILNMHHLSGLKLTEIGQVLNLAPGTARARYARARRRLRELWIECYGPEEFSR